MSRPFKVGDKVIDREGTRGVVVEKPDTATSQYFDDPIWVRIPEEGEVVHEYTAKGNFLSDKIKEFTFYDIRHLTKLERALE